MEENIKLFDYKKKKILTVTSNNEQKRRRKIISKTNQKKGNEIMKSNIAFLQCNNEFCWCQHDVISYTSNI